MVLVEQLRPRITADLTQLVIRVDDVSRDIGHADNGMLIECKFLVSQVRQGGTQV